MTYGKRFLSKGFTLTLLGLLMVFSCENPFSAGLGGGVDLGSPSIRVTNMDNGSYIRGAITIEGVWDDDKSAKEVKVTITDQVSGNQIAAMGAALNGKSWSVGFDSSGYSDGEKLLSFIVVDESDKETETRILLYFDNNAPISLVNLPSDLAASYNGQVRISGEAYDPYGIQQVSVAIYSDIAMTSLVLQGIAEGTSTWNFLFDSTSYYPSGTQDLYYQINVLDRAGNPSQYFFHYPEVFGANGSNQITVDKVYQIAHLPNAADTVSPHSITQDELMGTTGLKRTQALLKIDQDSDKPTFTFSSPELDYQVMGPGAKAVGLIEDDDGLDPLTTSFEYEIKLSMTPFDGSWTAGSPPSGNGLLLRWSCTLPAALGTYHMRLRAKDIYGKEGISGERFFKIDAGVPVVEISPPARIYFSDTETLTVSGTAGSSGGAVNEMWISRNGAPWVQIPAGNITGVGGENVTFSYGLSLAGVGNGTLSVAVKAIDYNGIDPDKEGSSNLGLRSDIDEPGSSLISPSTGERIYRQRELRGTSTDNNAVTEVAVKVGVDGTYTVLGATYSWSHIIANTNTYANTTHGTLMGDGSYEVPVSVRITDIATNQKVDTHYIYIDPSKDKPLATIISPPENAVLGGSFAIGGTAVDELPGVGVVEIQLIALQGATTNVIGRINPNTGNASADATWYPVAYSSGSWQFSFTENFKFYDVDHATGYPGSSHDGWYYLRVRSSDTQGTPLVGDYAERRFRMYNNAQAPSITTNALARTHYKSVDTIAISGSSTVPVGAVGQKVSEVRIQFDGGAPVVATLVPPGGAATVTWSANVSVPDQGVYNGQKTLTIEADGQNLAGDVETGVTSVYVNVDTQLPSATLVSPTVSQVVYRDITLTGTTGDNNAVQTVEIKIGKVGVYGAVASGTYGWSHPIANANTLADTTDSDWNGGMNAWECPVQIRVTDIAGNQYQLLTGKIFINPDADKPTVSVIAPPADSTMPTSFTASGIAMDERPGVGDVQFQLIALDGVTTNAISGTGYVNPVTGNSALSTDWYATTFSAGQWSYNFVENVKLLNVGAAGAAYPGSNHSGWFHIRVRARDSQGTPIVSSNVDRRFRIYKNPSAPTVTVSALANIYYRGGQVVSLSGTAASPVGQADMSIKTGDGIQYSFDGGAYSATGVVITPNPDMKTVTWTANLTLPPLVGINGQKTINVKGLTTNLVGDTYEGFGSTFVFIDSTLPTSDFTSPTNQATVYGPVNLRGTTSDNNSVVKVELRLGLPNTWIDIPTNLYNWSYLFDADTKANVTDSTWDGGINAWRMPIQQRITDIAGNIYTQLSYELIIDTDRDKPSVAFIAPLDGANIAGPSIVNGTAYDESPGILRVEAQFVALSGSSGETAVAGGGYLAPDGTASLASEWHVMTSTTLWSTELNTTGKFYNVGKAGMAYPALPDSGAGAHEGRFKLSVRAVDGNNKVGNVITRIIRFDDSIPKIDSLNVSAYSYVKGTMNLTGIITDDEQINSAQVSFDGGQTYTNLIAGTDYTVVDTKTYNLHLSVNTLTDIRIPASIRTNLNGVLNMRLRVTDNANYQSIQYLDLYVDNFYPSGAFTVVPGVTPDDLVSTAAQLRGSASDDGANVSVKGIEKVEIYFTRLTNVLNITTGTTLAQETVDFGNGQTNRPYTTNPAYKIEILRSHIYAVDKKEIQIDGTDFIWTLGFNSTNIGDGALTIHYVIHDKAGNRLHGTQAGFIKNNKPVITSVTTGTDLNYSDVVEAGEQFPFAANFNARNRLYLAINASGGNPGSLNYAVLEAAIPVAGAPNGTTSTGTVNISALPDGVKTYTLRVTDPLNIVVEQTFTYTVAQTDSTPPTMVINVLSQSNVPSGLGHLEETADNPLNPGVRPAVSGTMNVKGTAADTTRLKEIRLTLDGVGTNILIAEWDVAAKTLVSRNANFTIDTQDMSVMGGHVVYWTYVWNTKGATNSAGLNISMTMSSQDFRTGSPAAITAVRTYDVVPYITSVTTTQMTNGGIKANNIRAVSGRYSIKTGAINDFITISGFNLRPIANGVRISSVAFPSGLNGTTLVGTALANLAAADPYTTLSVRNNGTGSGYLSVVGGTAGAPIPSINNSNNNLLTQNKEPSATTGNLTLTDDRYVHFFTVTDTGFTSSFFPKMMMETDTPVWGYVQGSAANDLQVRRGTTSANNIGIVRILSADQLAMARDDDGRYHMLSVNNFNQGRLVYFYNIYETTPGYGGNGAATSPYWSGYGGILSSAANNNAIDLDSNNIGALSLGRVTNPQMIAKGRSNTAGQYSRVYMSWYDSATGELLFRNIRVGLGTAGANLYDTGRTNLADDGGMAATGSRKLVSTTASPYISMGVTDANIVVIVYYNQSTGYLELVYSATTPGGAVAAAVDLANPTTDTVNWSAPRVIGPLYTGWYVSMFMENDANAGTADPIHIAAYDTGSADLRYIYLTSYTDAVQKVARVDAMNSVGIYTDIKVLAGKPWIAYYNNSENGTRDSIRLARFNGTLPTVTDGANVDGTVTGNWEAMTAPVNTVPQGGLTKFTRVNLDFNSSGHPIVGYSASSIEHTRLLPEVP